MWEILYNCILLPFPTDYLARYHLEEAPTRSEKACMKLGTASAVNVGQKVYYRYVIMLAASSPYFISKFPFAGGSITIPLPLPPCTHLNFFCKKSWKTQPLANDWVPKKRESSLLDLSLST
ncbi:hypothetical protein PMIN03_011748 [Paraphaeosphaeria minitans]